MRLVEPAQRERLHDTFVELCRIESPSGGERRCADWVTRELQSIGLEVEEDDAAQAAGADAGNLLARVRGDDVPSVMLCAHLDTVPGQAPIEPVIRDGAWINQNEAILGADNKAAVAVLVELARVVMADAERHPIGVELVFTVSEENGLRGARAFDLGRLRSSFGYVFDHASPIGEIVIASPTYMKVTAELRGRAAHAGIRPEEGRSAIAAAARGIAALALGRLDSETTVNIGTIHGGSAANVVPERCLVEGEVRSLRHERAEELTTEVVDRFQDAADAAECDLDVTVERMFTGYRTKGSAVEVAVAERALLACGYEPRQIVTGGGSDANAFQARGFPCANLANGTERNHEPGERVAIGALEGMLDVALALVGEAANSLGASGMTGRAA